jgi:hypothetical protein
MEKTFTFIDKNFLIAVSLPVIFLIALYSYYQIDSYYSIKYWENSLKTNQVKNKTSYKLLYSITYENSKGILPTNYDMPEKIPSNSTSYGGFVFSQYFPSQIELKKTCELENNKLVTRSVGISESGELQEMDSFIDVYHTYTNQVFIYDFDSKNILPLDCNSGYEFNSLHRSIDSNYSFRYGLKSPDGLVDFSYGVNENVDYAKEFPFLRNKFNPNKESNQDELYVDEVLINGERVPTSSVMLDPENQIDFIANPYNDDGSIEILGWVK